MIMETDGLSTTLCFLHMNSMRPLEFLHMNSMRPLEFLHMNNMSPLEFLHMNSTHALDMTRYSDEARVLVDAWKGIYEAQTADEVGFYELRFADEANRKQRIVYISTSFLSKLGSISYNSTCGRLVLNVLSNNDVDGYTINRDMKLQNPAAYEGMVAAWKQELSDLASDLLTFD